MILEKEKTKLEQIKIDTAIQLKDIRDEIADVIFDMNQEKLEILWKLIFMEIILMILNGMK